MESAVPAPYNLQIHIEADQVVVSQPLPCQLAILEHLELLRDSPRKQSRPSAPPREIPGYLAHSFALVHEGQEHNYVILFNISDDDTVLLVDFIGHFVYGD